MQFKLVYVAKFTRRLNLTFAAQATNHLSALSRSSFLSSKPVDLTKSENLARLVSANVGMCVVNVAKAFVHFPDQVPVDARYVEGLWMVGGQVDIHAWIETNETILDPTLVRLEHWLQHEGVPHFPIITRSRQQVLRRFRGLRLDSTERLEQILNWYDPRVERVRRVVDPP